MVREKKIEASGQKKLGTGAETKILLQQGFLADYPEIAKEAWKRWCADYGSQAKHYSMISRGERDLYIIGGYSKVETKPENTAEEAAGMYLLVKESGGAIIDWYGEPIDDNKIGMKQDKNHDLIAASSLELAKEACENIIPDRYKE